MTISIKRGFQKSPDVTLGTMKGNIFFENTRFFKDFILSAKNRMLRFILHNNKKDSRMTNPFIPDF